MGLEKINDMRKHIGMSIDELSEKSGVPKGTLSKITAGITKNPSIDTVKAIVHTMGFTLDDLDDFPRSKGGNDLSAENMELIKKYSNLDAHGKKIVDFVLNEESERSKANQKLSEIMYDDYELSNTIQKAAHTCALYFGRFKRCGIKKIKTPLRRFPWKSYTPSSPLWAKNTTQKKSFSLALAPEETTTNAATLTLLSTVCRRKIKHASGVILMTFQPC